MKITAIETYPVGAGWKNWLFVRVITDGDGLYGVSEATINGFIKTTEAAIDELAHLSGWIRDFWQIDESSSSQFRVGPNAIKIFVYHFE
jgi:L-alanine-DL-glutamate epimerase-like enolase superfamily enzyme